MGSLELLRTRAESVGVTQVQKPGIGRIKVPRYLRPVDEFPMTVGGKVCKDEMLRIAFESLQLEGLAAVPHA